MPLPVQCMAWTGDIKLARGVLTKRVLGRKQADGRQGKACFCWKSRPLEQLFTSYGQWATAFSDLLTRRRS